MAVKGKKAFVEAIAFASAMGVLGAALIGAEAFEESQGAAFERSTLSSLAHRPGASVAVASRDPHFGRIFRVGTKGDALFGLFLSIRTTHGAALAAALFAPSGELQAVRLLGTNAAGQPSENEGWFADFLGRGGASAYPASRMAARSPSAISGASESFFVAAETFGRASEAVRAAAARRP